MKKILAILLAMSMLLALAVPTMAADPETFTNVVFEDYVGDTLKDDDTYHAQWDCVDQNNFGVTVAEVKEYIKQGGVRFQMLFGATGFATYEPKYAPDAMINLWASGECRVPMTVATYPAVEGITLPSANHKLYVASVELDDLMAAFEANGSYTVDDVANFCVQLWSFDFVLYSAWFTNDSNAGVSQTSFDVTWKSTFVENEWNSVPTIVEGTLQGGGEAGGRSELVNLWPAILAAVNNDISVIKGLGVSAKISNNYVWARQNEGAEGEAGPGAEIFINSDWTSYNVDWNIIDGNSFGLVENGTFTLNNVSYDLFSDVTKLQICVFGGDPYVDDNIATVTVTVSVVTGSIPTQKAEAYVGDVKYEKFADAVAAAKSGDTIKLVADCEADLVLLYPGVTLDLNGYKLTANNVVSFNTAHIVDNSEAKTGLLAVAKDNLAIGSSNNAQMPIWTGTGYVFATMKMQQKDSYDAETDALTLTFRPSFGTAFNSAFASGMADKGARVVVRVSWDDGNTTISKDFRYKEDFIKTVYATGGAFTFTATGLSDYSGVSVTVMVISDLKVECAGTAIISE